MSILYVVLCLSVDLSVIQINIYLKKGRISFISKQEADSLNVKQTSLKDGDLFNGRLDIPAYQNYDTWVVAGTSPAVKTADGKGITTYAKAIHYTAGKGKPVRFIASEKRSQEIGTGREGKTGYATISGKYILLLLLVSTK